jgi:heavy metal translocating P-type ATPase
MDHPHHAAPRQHSNTCCAPEPAAPVTDPVCGMKVNPATAKHRFDWQGQTYLFCCARCRERFVAEPARFLQPAEPAPPPVVAPGTIWTCPMHPEVRQDRPGTCPLCGMALEPALPTAEAGPNPELRDMSRRFWIGLILCAPVFVLAMSGMSGQAALGRFDPWIQFLLATPVVIWAGAPFFVRGWHSVLNRSLNMFSLIALGVGTAFLYSVAALLAPFLFPPGFRDPDGTVPTYFEAAAVIVVLVLLGQVLELRARDRTGSAIRALLKLAPSTARRLRADGADEEVPLDRVQVNDRLRIRPGDAVPVDGIVLEGSSSLDESMITGEAMPVTRRVGDHLIGGTLNGAGMLVMRAERIGSETVLARIVALVAEAQRSRAPVQRLADQVSAWFVPAVALVAALSFVLWAIWGPAPALAYGLLAGVSVLIIACPCALGLATPMSVQVGIGKAASVGVLIRSAEALERMERVDTLVLDKTGTLTLGKPRVVAVLPTSGTAEDELLRLAASLEQASEHPIAAAIVASARERNLPLESPAEFRALAGQGVRGLVAGRTVMLGNAALMRTQGIAPGALVAADDLRATGATVVFVATDDQLAGMIAVADPIKPTTKAALEALRHEGLRIVMLTGDNRRTAEAVARELGMAEIWADVLPADKHQVIRRLRNEGRVVAMAGDGLNDAPALAAADIGIAMGTGTEVAIQAAGITLVKGDLTGIARARRLSRATMRNIRQNLVLAFLYNAIGVPVAAGILYPAFGILLSPMIAALAMSLSSVSVIGNALRLRRIRV